MFTLGGLYPELRTFFTKHLGVQTLTAKMVYDKLKGSELSVDEARQTIVTFNSFLAGGRHEFDPAPVLKKAVFPVRFPNGEVKLLKGSDHFGLVDRQSLRDDFASQAKIFDFDLDETRQLKDFVEWTTLHLRNLSWTVKEITSADPDWTRRISLPQREIKRKARALLRLVTAFIYKYGT